MTRPERLAALVCVLCALAAVLLGCATKPEPLPHYPCRDAKGRVYQCDVWEWLEQQPTKGKQ